MSTIYLYVKQHNRTGLKYFGATQQDPYSYNGSGKNWGLHCKEHGWDISTIDVWEFGDKPSAKKFAKEFSRNNKIVKSDIWANYTDENVNLTTNPTNKPNQKGDKNPAFGKERKDVSLRNSKTKGFVWIYKGSKSKQIHPEILDYYLLEGWKEGMYPRDRSEERIKISKSTKGRATHNSNKIAISKNGKVKYIDRKELDKFLKSGYVRTEAIVEPTTPIGKFLGEELIDIYISPKDAVQKNQGIIPKIKYCTLWKYLKSGREYLGFRWKYL